MTDFDALERGRPVCMRCKMRHVMVLDVCGACHDELGEHYARDVAGPGEAERGLRASQPPERADAVGCAAAGESSPPAISRAPEAYSMLDDLKQRLEGVDVMNPALRAGPDTETAQLLRDTRELAEQASSGHLSPFWSARVELLCDLLARNTSPPSKP